MSALRGFTDSGLPIALIWVALLVLCAPLACNDSGEQNTVDGDQAVDGDLDTVSDGDSDAAEQETEAERPADEYEAVLWPSTHVLDQEQMDAQVLALADDATFTFAKDSPILADLSEKHVLMAGITTHTPGGFFGRITRIEENSTGGMDVHTEPCPIQYGFKSLHVKMVRDVDLTNDSIKWDVEPGTRILTPTEDGLRAKSDEKFFGPFTLDYYPFNGDNDPSTPEDQIHLVATLEGGIAYQFGIDFDWPDIDDVLGADVLPSIEVGFKLYAGAGATLDVDGVAWISFEREDTLGSAPLGVFAIGPLVFFPTVELRSKVEGGASSRFLMHTGVSAKVEAAAQYSTDNGGKLVPPTATYEVDSPVITSTENAQMRASIGPRLRLALWGIFGPHASLYVFGDLSSDSERDPCWSFETGVSGDVGIDLTLFGSTIADWSKPFDLLSVTPATGDCTPDPNAPEMTDITEPTFTPFSTRLVDTVVDFDLNRDFTALEPAVDGNWLLSGSGARTLIKLNNSGDLLWARSYVQRDAAIPAPLHVARAINTRDIGHVALMDSPAMIVKLNAIGKVQWALKPELAYQSASGLQNAIEDASGNLYFGGPYTDTDMGNSDAWIFKLSPSGELLWSMRWGREDIQEWVTGLLLLDGDLIVVGQSFGLAQDPASQSFAARLSTDGSVRWLNEISGCSGTESVNLRTAIVSNDGDIIAGGSFGIGGPKALLVKIKPDGAFGWANGNDSGGLGIDISGMSELSDGGYLMAGTWWTAGVDHLWVARSDSIGRINWIRQLSDLADDGSPAIRLNGEGGALLAGYSSKGVERASLWVTRLPVKTGDITLDPAHGAVTQEQAVVTDEPCISLTPTTTVIKQLTVEFVYEAVTSQELTIEEIDLL
jgi:hypothetical protein